MEKYGFAFHNDPGSKIQFDSRITSSMHAIHPRTRNKYQRGIAMDILTELHQIGVTRRNFLAGASALGAASVLAGCSDNGPATPVTDSTISDTVILNFALNLEYLEASYYLYAATGSGLSAADMGSGTGLGKVTGGTKIPGLVAGQQDFLTELAYTEQQHVRFLRSALGSAAIPMPNIDIVNSFNALAIAAGISAGFNPYASFDAFLVGAFVFEDVGVTAYAGAAPLISSAGITSGLLSYAAGIQAVEAYHAGCLRTQLTAGAIAFAASSTSFPYLGYANQIATLRATLGGGNETQLSVPNSISTPSSIVAASSSTAVGYARTLDQVLHIVYGTGTGAGVDKGGFFPSGLNGGYTITQT
jgi:hypothetical protein